MITVAIALIFSFVLVILLMPGTIRALREKGITGTDVHKPDRPEVPKGAGYILLFAIVSSLLVCIGIRTFGLELIINPGLLAALVSILMAGMIGLLDDTLDFSNRTKVVLPLIASIPMMALNVGTTTMSIPIIGTLDLGILYPLVIVPLIMTFIIDSTNMYGGMNGLETGLAAINASSLVIYVILIPVMTGAEISSSQIDASTVAAALLGATVAFYIFNRYPAKVLPGDVGRLPIGAAMAVALVLGNFDRLAIVLYFTFGINFLMYLVYRVYVKRKGKEWVKFAKPRDDGTMEVEGPFTMYWLFPWLSDNITEKKNVMLLLILQALIAYGGLFLLLFAYPFNSGLI